MRFRRGLKALPQPNTLTVGTASVAAPFSGVTWEPQDGGPSIEVLQELSAALRRDVWSGSRDTDRR